MGDCSCKCHYPEIAAQRCYYSWLFNLTIEHAILTFVRTYLSGTLGNDKLLRSVDFRRFWLSSVLNGFGGQITALALPLCAALLLHATPAQMGTLVALQALPFALFGLPVGVWLDRSRKLPIMLYCEILFGMALASVAAAQWLGLLSMPWLYAVGFLLGTGFVIGGGAEQVFLTYLVGRDGLIDAQSKFAATDSAARLIGPGIAGALIGSLSAPFAILINALGFLISFWNLKKINVREPKPAPSTTHALREMKDGIVFIWRHPVLRTLAWGAAIWHFLFYGFMALQILFATRELGMTAGVLGSLQMLGGVGVLAGSFLIKPLSGRFGVGGTILIGIGCTAAGFVLIAAIPVALFGSSRASAAMYGAVNFVLDCGGILFFMPYLALRQKVTPDAFLGRMVSTMRFLTVAAAPLGALAAGAIAEHASVRAGLMCVAAGGVALTGAMAFASQLRSVRH